MRLKLIEFILGILMLAAPAILPTLPFWMGLSLYGVGFVILLYLLIEWLFPQLFTLGRGKSTNMVSVRLALRYAAVRDWDYDWTKPADVADAKIIADEEEARGQFFQYARDGEIIVRGRPSETAPFEDIPKEHWRDFSIDEMEAWEYTPQATPVKSRSNLLHEPLKEGYYDLVVNKRDIERKWPKNKVRRLTRG